MKLTAKLMLMLLGVLIIGVAVNSYLRVQREVKFFDFDMERDERAIGYAVRNVVASVWELAGKQRAVDLVDRANHEGQIVRFRWIWVDAPVDDPRGPRLPRSDLEPLTRGETVSVKLDHGRYGGYRYTCVPLQVEPAALGAIEVSEPLSQISDYTRATITRTVINAGLMTASSVCLMIVCGIWLVGRPLLKLTDKARRVGEGDLGGPLHIPGRDELSGLAASMNWMCENLIVARERIATETAARIDAIEQLRHADRLKTVGRLAAGIAHELGTPLNVVSGRAALIESGGLPPREIASNAKIIRAQSERIAKLIRQLLDFARRRSLEKTIVDLRQVMQRTLEFVGSLAHKQRVELSMVDEGGVMTVLGDAAQLDQALTNLVMNAIQAVSSGGKIELSLRREHVCSPKDIEAPEGEYICLAVQDDGEGITAENLPHIFEPFFTTKGLGQGTGLGLSIAYGIVREHGGWIGVSSTVGQGSRFSIYVPRGSD